MINTEYYEEMATYYFTDYEFRKNLDLQTERIKKSSVEFLEKAVEALKERLPEDKPSKPGKVVRLGSR